ncbi:MAG: SxtJ family membrane protein [Thermoproteota archaeon]|nr:SxtJ family membrane protein [Thermoproteota archaeon]
MNRRQNLETILVLVLASIVLYKIRKHEYLLWAAIIIGITGLFVPWAAEKIHWIWMKLGEALGFVMSKVLLTIIYFIILMPFSIFSKKNNKKQRYAQIKAGTSFIHRNFRYTKESMEKMW